MTETFDDAPGLVRIEITAADLDTAKKAAERIAGFWLSSPSPLRRIPGNDGVLVRVHADIARSPDEGGYLPPEDDPGA
ncbi:DUF6207 family protein [Streptomyces sp. NPDC005408]|uniref:DUF6207 family protein n=1 Tax=Streptomyces sp. NPDC005408 TaxID=3155341 RepID=UPI0033AB7AF9